MWWSWNVFMLPPSSPLAWMKHFNFSLRRHYTFRTSQMLGYHIRTWGTKPLWKPEGGHKNVKILAIWACHLSLITFLSTSFTISDQRPWRQLARYNLVLCGTMSILCVLETLWPQMSTCLRLAVSQCSQFPCVHVLVSICFLCAAAAPFGAIRALASF